MNIFNKKIITGFLFVFSSLMYLSCQSFSPLQSEIINDNIFSINSNIVNMYILQIGESYIAIDTGTDENKIGNELKKLKINKEKVIAVFLTHSDNDHVGSLNLFKNAKIYIGKDENQIIEGKIKRIYSKKINQSYELLDDGQIIEINEIKIKCVFTPGHTIGSVSYLINDCFLFTGDTLSIKNGKADVFNKSYNMDNDTQTNSIIKLSLFKGIKYIFSGHHGYSDDFDKLFESWK